MPAKWTGILVGKAHNADIPLKDIAEEAGTSRQLLSIVLHKENTTKAEKERYTSAFNRLLEKKNGQSV